MTRREIEDLFKRREQLMCQHDEAAFMQLYAEDALVESPTVGGTVTGRSAIKGITHAWFTGFPDVQFTTKELIVEGERVVWTVTVHGTDTGGFLGLPPTNKPFSLPMVVICTVRDGFIVQERRIYDFTGMLVQIGVLKTKPA